MLDPCSSDPSKSAFPSRFGRPIVVAVALVAVAVALAVAAAAVANGVKFPKRERIIRPFCTLLRRCRCRRRRHSVVIKINLNDCLALIMLYVPRTVVPPKKHSTGIACNCRSRVVVAVVVVAAAHL